MPSKRQKVENEQIKETKIENPFAQDADEQFSQSEGSDSRNDVSNSEDSNSDEDELELLKEYEKIKKEREEEQRRLELEKMEELKKKQAEEVLTGNPLLNQQLADAGQPGVFSLNRKWHEETVFKHQARNKVIDKQRFVNDTVRSDFHRKFLSKTI